MAKKKKKGTAAPAGFAAMSPDKYIRAKARTLPLGKCYVNPGWQADGLAEIVVTRTRPSGNLVVACFLVDTFCMGVKGAFCRHNITPEDFDDRLCEILPVGDMAEISYPEAHNIIYGAIEFAEEAGLEPVPDFTLAEYVLEEDTDDVPLIEYNFGKEGKHFLVCGPEGREKKLIPELRRRLGEDFDFAQPVSDILDMFDDDESCYVEHYSYEYPEYPAEAVVKHQFVADTLLSPEYADILPEGFAGRVFALPPDEAAADLGAVILYEIGRSWRRINEGDFDRENGAIFHAVNLLACIDSPSALPALLDVARMNDDFLDVQLGDICAEHLPQAIWRATAGNIAPLEDYLREEGLNVWMRLKVVEALTITALHTPGAFPAVVGAYRRLMQRLVSEHESGNGEELDPSFTGCIIGELLEFDCTELLPEIEALYGTHRVDFGVAGDLAEVRRIISSGEFFMTKEIYTWADIQKRFRF
ncbi:MAG: DUF1186 family protein [Muribaculaceae bacterium]|nr:DUF1186 family protein [Muribaculaceae bacterium]